MKTLSPFATHNASGLVRSQPRQRSAKDRQKHVIGRVKRSFRGFFQTVEEDAERTTAGNDLGGELVRGLTQVQTDIAFALEHLENVPRLARHQVPVNSELAVGDWAIVQEHVMPSVVPSVVTALVGQVKAEGRIP